MNPASFETVMLCSDNPDQLPNLPGMDITEKELRRIIREEIKTNRRANPDPDPESPRCYYLTREDVEDILRARLPGLIREAISREADQGIHLQGGSKLSES